MFKLFTMILSVVTLAAIEHVESFQVITTRKSNKHRSGISCPTPIGLTYHDFSTPSASLYAKSQTMPDILPDQDIAESGVDRIRVKNIEREWTWGDDYTATGEFSVDTFIPEGEIKGCVFFMHGFSQYPVAYQKTLKLTADNANIAIIACETGLTSGIVLKDIASKPFSFITEPSWPQFALQRALSEDTKQCIDMVLKNDEAFKEYGITKDLPLGVCGHSMGGGLCFYVAKTFPEVNHLFAMAPAEGVEPFEPLCAIEDKNTDVTDNSMLLAGNWDLIAPSDKIKQMSVDSNKEKSMSSILVNIQRGVHTGFEDKLVIFGIPIVNGLGLIAIFFNILGFGEFLFLKLLSLVRTNTGQLEGTRALMDYFFGQMANGEEITVEGAKEKVADSIKEKWEDKFDIKYGE